MTAFYPIRTGRKACPASPAPAEPLVATFKAAQKGIMLTNDNGALPNGSTGVCYWGGPDVTAANGQPLRPGASVSIGTDDAANVYVVASDATTTVSWAVI